MHRLIPFGPRIFAKTSLLKIGFAALGAALLFPVAASAEDAQSTADLRCLIIGFKLSGSSTPAQQNAGVIATLYYLGRLDGRTDKLDLEKLVVSELPKMTAQDFQVESKRCGQLLSSRGHALQQLGKDLMAREKK
jgi:hypothetical protein